MAIKSGFSHSLVTLMLTLISSLLVYFLGFLELFEKILEYIHGFSEKIALWFESIVDIKITHELLLVIFIGSLFIFVWGIVFFIIRNK